MIRTAGLVAALGAALTVAATMAAAEGGAIRSGEHGDFSRLVLQVDPTTEWSLETGERSAVIRFPGKPLVFSTSGIFDRIPRTRILAVTATTGAAETEIAVELGCDCRVSTAFVGARYLALDISERGAVRPDSPSAPPAPEDADARAAREATAVATAEELLLAQIERAAGQGLVQLALRAPEAEPAQPAAAKRPDAEAAPTPASPGPEPQAAGPDALEQLREEEQIEATTVYDRDDGLARARRALAAAPDACLPDDDFDVADWPTGADWAQRLAVERSRLVGEFDRPDAAAVRSLAQFYLRHGFGAETRALLQGFPEVDGLDDRPLLVDLARVVDGEAVTTDGPLALAVPCPGRHALWLALGGVAPAFHDDDQFAAVDAAFAELPPDLRALVGPGLVGRLLDADRPAEARRILDSGRRNGDAPTPAMEVAEARLVAADGDPVDAVRRLAALAGGQDPTALEALVRVTRLALDAGLPLPDHLATDLRAAALQYRGTPHEVELRALLVEVLADRAELPAAVREARSAARDLPGDGRRFDALAVRELAAADPSTVRTARYVKTVLDAADLIAGAPAADPSRSVIADHLIDLGLPGPALRVLAPALPDGARTERLAGARAQLRLGRPDTALSTLSGLYGPGSAELRARSFALGGDYTRALAFFNQRVSASAAGYAWPAGDWLRVTREAGGDPVRLAMAGYMASRDGGAAPSPSADPEALTPELAFQEPVPDLARPSLSAARRLLSTGPKVGGLVADVLADHR